jgi:hypothetical protein
LLDQFPFFFITVDINNKLRFAFVAFETDFCNFLERDMHISFLNHIKTSDGFSENVARAAFSASCNHFPKNIRIVPVITSEGKLSKVQRQILFAYVVEASHNAALEQRPEGINGRSMDQPAHIFVCTMVYCFVREIWLEIIIARCFVSSDQRDFLIHSLSRESIKGSFVCILDHLTNDVALAADGADYRNLSSRPASFLLLVPMPILVFSADIGFINLDFTQQLCNVFILHRRANAVAHIPSRAIVAAPNLPVNLKRANPLLALSHQINNLEPSAKRVVRILENGARDNGEAIAVFTTAIFVLANPMERASLQLIYLFIVAAWTAYTTRPTQFFQISLASFFRREASFNLRQRNIGFRAKDFCFHDF